MAFPLPAAKETLPPTEPGEATWGSAVKLGAEFAGRLLGLLTTLLIARSLRVEDFGVFAAFSGVAVLLAELADLGLQGSACRALVSRTFPLRSFLTAKLLLSLLVIAGFLLVSFSGALLSGSHSPGSDIKELLLPLVLYFVLAGWSEFLGVVLRARDRRRGEALVILTLRAAGLMLVALVVAARGGLEAFVWVLAASTLPSVLLAGALVRRSPAEACGVGPTDPSHVGTWACIRAALPLGVNGGLALAGLRVELLALALLRGSRAVGLFAAALRIVEFLLFVPGAITAGAMPGLTREALRGGGPVRERTSTTVALLAVPGTVGLMLVAPGLIERLFGREYAGAALPLRLLALAVIALFMNTVLLNALIAAGRAAWLPRLTGLRVALAVVLAWALVPRLGLAGAAVGFVVSECLLFALAARASRAAGFAAPLARPLALGLCTSLPMAAALALVGGGPLVSVALGVLIYVVTLTAFWRFTPGFVVTGRSGVFS